MRDTDYLVTYPKVLWKYRHVPGSETSNKWKQLKAVIRMYQEVLGFSAFKANMIVFLLFLPNNIWRKIQKRF